MKTAAENVPLFCIISAVALAEVEGRAVLYHTRTLLGGAFIIEEFHRFLVYYLVYLIIMAYYLRICD